MTLLITLLLRSLYFDGLPVCAPEPTIVWTAPPDVANERECKLHEWPEYRCQAEGGRILLHRWYATVDGVPYKVEIRERVFGHQLDYAGQRVYRRGALVRSAPLLSTFEGEKMVRVRPVTCDLPSVNLTDA